MSVPLNFKFFCSFSLQVFGVAVDAKIKNAIFAFIVSGVGAGVTALVSIIIKNYKL